MAADITNKFNQATTTGRPSPAALTAVKTIGATSLTVDSTAEWPTDTAVHFIIYEVDANNDKIQGTQCDFKGIVNSATTINNLTLKAGTDREYPIGSKVVAAPTAAWADDVVEGLVVSLNQDGTLKDDSVVTANITDANVTAPKVADGFAVQSVSTNFSAAATGTTIIPLDDTIPQNTEGVEFMTQAITPKSSTNILVIETTIMLSSSVVDNLIAALFQDSTANALAATIHSNVSANTRYVLTLRHRMVAGTTSATTFKVRAGGNAAGTRTFNGSGGTRTFGGATVSNITVTEYKAS